MSDPRPDLPEFYETALVDAKMWARCCGGDTGLAWQNAVRQIEKLEAKGKPWTCRAWRSIRRHPLFPGVALIEVVEAQPVKAFRTRSRKAFRKRTRSK